MKALHVLTLCCVAFAAAASTGCGSLNVSVDVLDPGHVQQEMADESLRKLYREIFAAQPGDFALRVDRQFDAFKKELGQLTNDFRATAAKLQPSERQSIERSAKALDDAIGPAGTYRNDASRNGTLLETLAQDARATGARLGYGNRNAMPAELRDLLRAFQSEEQRLRVAQIKDVREAERNLQTLVRTAAAAQANKAAAVAAAAAPAAAASATEASARAKSNEATAAALAPALNAVEQQSAATVAAIQRSIIQDGSLAATEFAFVVANAPDTLWKRDFNKAYASGQWGNVDMVIRLNSTADFSVKGMLFDASKVAQVASKVLTQAVLLGAQMSGVPVAAASTATQTGGDALSKSSVDLGTADAALAKRQAQVGAQKDAIRSLARSLLSASPNLTSDALKNQPATDAGRIAVHDGIDASIAALRNLVVMQDLQ